MDKISLVLAAGAAVTLFGGIIQAIVAGIELKNRVVQSSKKKQWLTIVLISTILTVVFGGASYVSSLKPDSSSTTSRSTATSAATVASSSSALSPTATSTPISNDYSAAQPGNSCDTSGGTWSSQGLNPFACGQPINPVSTGVWGYLSLQLPHNAAFSANNKITVTGSTFDARWVACIGLAEIGESTGYLIAYCGNGLWSVYTVSNNGTIIQPIKSNIPTTLRTSTTISLILNRDTLLFQIDTEHYQIPVSPIQLTKIAIGIEKNPGCDTCSIQPTNFNYITPAN